MDGRTNVADEHDLAIAAAENAQHHLGIVAIELLICTHVGCGSGGAGNFAFDGLVRPGLCGTRYQVLTSRVEFDPENVAGEAKKRLQLQGWIAEEQRIAIANEELPVIEHVEVVRVIVDGPDSLSLDGARGQTEDHGANLSLVMRVAFGAVAMNEGGHAESEQKVVLVKEIEGN